MSDELLIKLFLLSVLLFFLEALLSFEFSLDQSSRSSSVFNPLIFETIDLSPSLSLLKGREVK